MVKTLHWRVTSSLFVTAASNAQTHEPVNRTTDKAKDKEPTCERCPSLRKKTLGKGDRERKREEGRPNNQAPFSSLSA